ncbi:diguanylate cyclase (GGDEF)-like protein [Robbsia andropogonis]|uniref:putative bifunctional diguanylate cyclase/phosphodiesterase n=1 Tax=Robbsia andropogonis TaxID=28092 RepID=UPI00158A76AA|nr:bifunctional diguanylate cyclase/phosphodiesterase [Robbsia andropogonis]MCP1117435.1 EAL domain-containing protein [Robbsia andropogonis]MCP1126901.1 EAL domain-containing protein [Robbsia andropogonis]
MLVGSYDTLLVLFSVLVAMLASYTALDLVGRITTAGGKAAVWWLVGGAIAMGFGVWSMHFIGMLAFSLPNIDIGFDVPLTVLSLIIVILASLLALRLASRPALPWHRLLVGALLMGGGIAAMHYTGMAAMKMDPAIVWRPSRIVLSIVVGVLASGLGMHIAFRLRHLALHVRYYRLGASVVMGLAIACMHYVGMSAAEFPLGSICGAASTGLDANALALPILVITVAVLAVALITSILDMRLEINTAILSSSLAEANQELSRIALHDTLTRLPNRMLLMDRLEKAIETASATRTMFTVMFVDLDGFKSVNDTFGHHLGDQLLVQVSERIRQNVHAQDTCARLGGDEFVVLSPIPGAADAATIAERLVNVLDEPFVVAGHHLSVSASIGIALYPGDGDSPGDLVKSADIAMYHAKSAGRNQACFFEGSMHTDNTNHLMLLHDMRLARKRDEFVLYYQPKFRAPNGPMIGAEALLRWNHPTRGRIGPDEFIPLAERSGLIIGIGEWVLDEACRQLAEWHRSARTDAGRALTMAVNISTAQFNHPRFTEMIVETIAKHEIAPAKLTLEITESTAMQDVDANLAILEKLNEIGVRISIDDFGTGYSSLLYLKRMPASELKIDRGFVMNLENSSEDAAIVSAIVALGGTLKLNIVAEGVETDEQQALLTRLGCDLLQGFLLGKPMEAAGFTELI